MRADNKFNKDAPSPLPQSASATQLRFFKFLTILLAIALVAGIGYTAYKQHQVEPVEILVNGNPVAVAMNSTIAARALSDIRTGAAEGVDLSAMAPRFTEKVQYQLAGKQGSNTRIDGDDDVTAKLKAVLHVTVQCSMICVDKQPVVALSSDALAQKALDNVKDYYAQMPPSDPFAEKPKFVEHVTINDERASANFVKENAGDAVKFLTTAPPAKTYAVQSHETGWSIARKFHIPFGKFRASNTGRDIDRLGIGDIVNVSVTVPPVTVLVKKSVNREEPILKNAPPDKAGKRQLSEVLTYLNGQLTGEPQQMSVQVLQPASPLNSL